MKKTTTVICALLTATSILCVSGCGKKADLVVANAGGKKITVGDLSQAVTTLLRQREEKRLFNELIKNLREKYDPPITIYENILQKIITGGTDVSAQS